MYLKRPEKNKQYALTLLQKTLYRKTEHLLSSGFQVYYQKKSSALMIKFLAPKNKYYRCVTDSLTY